MKKILIYLCLGVPFSAWSDYKVDNQVCNADTTPSGKIYRPLRETSIREGWERQSPIKLDKSLSKILKRDIYYNIDIYQTAFEHCRYRDSSYIQVINDEGQITPATGWVDTATFTTKLDPSNKYEGLIREYIYKDKEDDYYEGRDFLRKMQPDLKTLTVKAAEKVIDSKQCDIVFDSYISTFAKENDIKVIVECAIPNKKFTLSKEEIFKGTVIQSNLEKSLSNKEALEKCKEMIKDKANNSKSLKFHDIVGTSYYQAPTGNVRLILDFDVNSIKYRGICIFPIEDDAELTVQPK